LVLLSVAMGASIPLGYSNVLLQQSITSRLSALESECTEISDALI